MNLKGKTYLVTGGSGFLGVKLIERLLEKEGANVKTICRNEGNLIKLKIMYPQLEIVTGDISDPTSLAHAIKDVDGIFHLAAYKHVGLAEKYVSQCINSNVVGTMNLLEATRGNKRIEFIIGISTDKACQVNGTYGASKMLMEKLFYEFQDINPDIKYRLVRYGNVLYSTGSVLCKWKELLLQGKEIIITDENVTRFYWTVDEAIKLIFECLENSVDCTPYLPEMKSMVLKDLLTAMTQKYLPKNCELKVKRIGLQLGENFHERILENGKTSNEVQKYTVEEIMEMV
jgi:UDP-N-acetylglucosamine 4,6-dehydratase/5-epimerase